MLRVRLVLSMSLLLSSLKFKPFSSPEPESMLTGLHHSIFLKTTSPPEEWWKFKVISHNRFSQCPLPKLYMWFCSAKQNCHMRKPLNDTPCSITDPNSKVFYRQFSHNVLYHICENRFAPLKKWLCEVKIIKKDL